MERVPRVRESDDRGSVDVLATLMLTDATSVRQIDVESMQQSWASCKSLNSTDDLISSAADLTIGRLAPYGH